MSHTFTSILVYVKRKYKCHCCDTSFRGMFKMQYFVKKLLKKFNQIWWPKFFRHFFEREKKLPQNIASIKIFSIDVTLQWKLNFYFTYMYCQHLAHNHSQPFICFIQKKKQKYVKRFHCANLIPRTHFCCSCFCCSCFYLFVFSFEWSL